MMSSLNSRKQHNKSFIMDSLMDRWSPIVFWQAKWDIMRGREEEIKLEDRLIVFC